MHPEPATKPPLDQYRMVIIYKMSSGMGIYLGLICRGLAPITFVEFRIFPSPPLQISRLPFSAMSALSTIVAGLAAASY
jgi:hypothetical protein